MSYDRCNILSFAGGEEAPTKDSLTNGSPTGPRWLLWFWAPSLLLVRLPSGIFLCWTPHPIHPHRHWPMVTLIRPHIFLRSGVSNCFLKRPDSKYFQLCSHRVSVQWLNSVLAVRKQPQTINTWAWPCSDKTLFTNTQTGVSHNFHKILTILLWILIQPF